jgi:hypothetical protein
LFDRLREPVNTAAKPLALPRPLRAVGVTLLGWRAALGSLPAITWKWAGLVALFGTLLDCALIVAARRPSVGIAALLPFFAAFAIDWAVEVTLTVCAWAIADRAGGASERRAARLAAALLVAVLLAAVLVPALTTLAVGRLDFCAVEGCEGHDWSKVPWWLLSVDDSGQMLIFAGLVFAWLEMVRRNREIEGRLLAAQQERSRLLRSAFDARLTAMRAQVDPQFLFESLADVQTAYSRQNARGAALLDRLIAYLRTALPRLHTEGSTIGSEAELVDAWLAVAGARRAGRLSWRLEMDPGCASASFPATVLLPLVQCALAGVDRPQRLVLSVSHAPEGAWLIARLRLEPGCPCRDDDPEPRRIRGRMRAVFGETVSLACAREAATGADGADREPATVITLQWPDEGADRDRR